MNGIQSHHIGPRNPWVSPSGGLNGKRDLQGTAADEPMDGLVLHSRPQSMQLPGGAHQQIPQDGQELVLGREQGVLIRSRFVSARHLGVKCENGQLLVRDLGSTNGSFHFDPVDQEWKGLSRNWTPLGANALVRLGHQDQDQIRFQSQTPPVSLNKTPAPKPAAPSGSAKGIGWLAGLASGAGAALGMGALALSCPPAAAGLALAAGLYTAVKAKVSAEVGGKRRPLIEGGMRVLLGAAATAATMFPLGAGALVGWRVGRKVAEKLAGASGVDHGLKPKKWSEPQPYVAADRVSHIFQDQTEETRIKFSPDGSLDKQVVRLKISPEMLDSRFGSFDWRDDQGNRLSAPPLLEKGMVLFEKVGSLEHTRTYLGQDPETGNHMFGFAVSVPADKAQKELERCQTVHREYKQWHQNVSLGIEQWKQSEEGNCSSVAVIKAGLHRFGPRLLQQCLPDQKGGFDITLRDGYTLNLSRSEVEMAHRAAKWAGSGQSREMAVFAFAALAKRSQETQLKGCRGFPGALQALNTGMDPAQVARLMGLGAHVVRLNESELAKGSDRADMIFGCSERHAVAAWKDKDGHWAVDHYGQVVPFQGEDTNGNQLVDGYYLKGGL